MGPRLRISFVASEMSPLAKTGGLADVVGSLPKELEKLGHKVSVFIPYYREVKQVSKIPTQVVRTAMPVHLGQGMTQEVNVLQATLPKSKVPVYLIENSKAFDRDHLYGTMDGDYADNGERFILFSRAVIQWMREMKEEIDIIHCHDWQTALIPVYIKRVYSGESVFARTSTIFTIHNMAYQGLFPKEVMQRTGLGWELFTPEQFEFWGKVNFLKAGIVYADRVTTVSPTYAKEVLTPGFGLGMDGIMRTREKDLIGLLNGVDYDEWDPASDPHLPATYTKKVMTGKAACKAALKEEFGLHSPEGKRVMLIGAVSRLAEQKGFEIVSAALSRLGKRPIQFVMLGSGDRKIHEMMEEAARKHPHSIGIKLKFDNALAHRIYAGSDAFIIPSRFEPCGLGQMIAMKYGTVPIAHATGGLIDTIKPIEKKNKQGTGFLFKEMTQENLLKCIDEALELYDNEAAWKKLTADIQSEDFSWQASAKRYEALYAEEKGKKTRK